MLRTRRSLRPGRLREVTKMEKVTLTPNGEKYLVLEAECITPDNFAGKTLEQIADMQVWEGNAGNYCGASYRGDWRGMKGGNILVKGNAGCDIGEYMVGGTITVMGNADINAGIHAGRAVGAKEPGGRIVIYGDSPGRVGAQMTRGNIYLLGKIETMMPGFALKETKAVDFDGKPVPFNVYMGDRAEAGKGTLYVKT